VSSSFSYLSPDLLWNRCQCGSSLETLSDERTIPEVIKAAGESVKESSAAPRTLDAFGWPVFTRRIEHIFE
jgi:hypothetical protein